MTPQDGPTTGTGCRRFDSEGVLLLERGRALGEHFDTCPDCRTARAKHDRLLAALATPDPNTRGRGDWQAGVWAEVHGRQARRRWLRWAWGLGLPLAAAAAVVFMVLSLRSAGPDSKLALTLTLTIDVQARTAVATEPRRGHSMQVGDVLIASANVGRADHAELRVYRDDMRLVAACSDAPPCRPGPAHALSLEIELVTPGRYQIVALASSRPVPPATGAFDRDIATARNSGALVRLTEMTVY